MRRATMTAAILAMLAARASAQGIPQTLGGDPLTRQILMKTSQKDSGVTAVVRVGSGQPVELKLSPAVAAPFSTVLAPPVESPATRLKPAPGLAPKAARAKGRKPARRAVDQLRRVSERKSWSAR